MYGGFETIISKLVPIELSQKHWIKFMFFRPREFIFAVRNAIKLISVAVIFQVGISSAMLMPIAPVPVPKSRTFRHFFLFSDKISSTRSSVSGRGIRVSAVTRNSFFQKPSIPVM